MELREDLEINLHSIKEEALARPKYDHENCRKDSPPIKKLTSRHEKVI